MTCMEDQRLSLKTAELLDVIEMLVQLFHRDFLELRRGFAGEPAQIFLTEHGQEQMPRADVGGAEIDRSEIPRFGD